MEYIKIPIKDRLEGKDLAEYYFGAMIWRKMPNGDLEAYPYDNDSPVILTAESPPKTE